ncbi:MAG: hypothetical protein KIS92_00095 [Planctomycetota bacterium]|nr:hypothetical protein [Planctomycetota bacterium]
MAARTPPSNLAPTLRQPWRKRMLVFATVLLWGLAAIDRGFAMERPILTVYGVSMYLLMAYLSIADDRGYPVFHLSRLCSVSLGFSVFLGILLWNRA